MTLWWARWRLKSPASQLFIQPFIWALMKENIKAPRHWPLCREFTGDRCGEFPAQMTGNAEKFPFDDVIMTALWSMSSPSLPDRWHNNCDHWQIYCDQPDWNISHPSVIRYDCISANNIRALRYVCNMWHFALNDLSVMQTHSKHKAVLSIMGYNLTIINDNV